MRFESKPGDSNLVWPSFIEFALQPLAAVQSEPFSFRFGNS